MRVAVMISTVREGGLDWQLAQFARQTFKNFEIVLVDAFWERRVEQIAQLSSQLGLTVHHIPAPKLTYVTELTHASNRNACIEAALKLNPDTLIFFDDYQVPSVNFVETHVNLCRPGMAVAGRQISLWYNPDRNYSQLFTHTKDELEHEDARIVAGHREGYLAASAFWTGNASISAYDVRVNNLWFDERMNGGTGGEDGDFGLRFGSLGIELFFTLSCHIYHISHKHPRQQSYKEQMPKTVDLALCVHDRAPFTYNQYQQGNQHLVEAGSLFTWRDSATGIKYYVCKNCGLVGCIDSIEVLNSNIKYRFCPRPLRGSYVPLCAPYSIASKLAVVYGGTGFTYYEDALK